MKAVLLAAGKGIRLAPITNEFPKQMIPVAGKPLLEYIINQLSECGFDNICIIVGCNKKKIKEYFKNGNKFNVNLTYVAQKDYKGTADATRYAKDFVKDDAFLLYLSDTIIPSGLEKFFKKISHEKSDIDILSAKIPSFQLQIVGTIKIDNNNFVTKISEKSSIKSSNLAWAGVAFFKTNSIFDAIQVLNTSFRDELEITEAICNTIKMGKKVKNHLCKKFIDFGTPNGLYEVMKFVLANKNYNSFHKKLYIKNKLKVVEPIFLGKDCKIGRNVKLGPIVSIANGVTINNYVDIENSIIFDTNIPRHQKISNSIIYRDLKLSFTK